MFKPTISFAMVDDSINKFLCFFLPWRITETEAAPRLWRTTLREGEAPMAVQSFPLKINVVEH